MLEILLIILRKCTPGCENKLPGTCTWFISVTNYKVLFGKTKLHLPPMGF